MRKNKEVNRGVKESEIVQLVDRSCDKCEPSPTIKSDDEKSLIETLPTEKKMRFSKIISFDITCAFD